MVKFDDEESLEDFTANFEKISMNIIDPSIATCTTHSDSSSKAKGILSPTKSDTDFVNSTPQKQSHVTPKKPSDKLSLLSPESDLYSTPADKRNNCTSEDLCLCSVCLSPLLLRTAVVETRCKHQFHEKCLQAVKGCKAECPNCRSALTPQVKALFNASDVDDASRSHLHNRIANARDAVRLATVRREHERQRLQAVPS